MAIIVKAPDNYDLFEKCSVFLCGSIEEDKAINWQSQIVTHWQDLPDLVVFNPRRDDWDNSWIQKKENPQFSEQVRWELERQKEVDLIAVYFDPNSKSVVTMAELGLFANTGKQVVCCPEGYFRKGNVDIICEEWKIPQVDTLIELSDEVRNRVELKEFQSLQGYWKD